MTNLKKTFTHSKPLHPTLVTVLRALTPEGPWLAGGAARKLWFDQDLGSSDLDIFCVNEKQAFQFKVMLRDLTAKQIANTPNNTTYDLKGVKIQVIDGQFYENMNALVESFDFRMCQFVCDGEAVETTTNAVLDAKSDYLTINRIALPLYTLARVAKYADQGFVCGEAVLMQLARAAQAELAAKGEGGSHGV